MTSDDRIMHFPSKKVKCTSFLKKAKPVEVKNFLGFEYIKLKRDVNGISFNMKSLCDFASELGYNISVARQIKDKTFLYEYFVPSLELKKFFSACIDGTIEGEIIQIEKHNPENLA